MDRFNIYGWVPPLWLSWLVIAGVVSSAVFALWNFLGKLLTILRELLDWIRGKSKEKMIGLLGTPGDLITEGPYKGYRKYYSTPIFTRHLVKMPGSKARKMLLKAMPYCKEDGNGGRHIPIWDNNMAVEVQLFLRNNLGDLFPNGIAKHIVNRLSGDARHFAPAVITGTPMLDDEGQKMAGELFLHIGRDPENVRDAEGKSDADIFVSHPRNKWLLHTLLPTFDGNRWKPITADHPHATRLEVSIDMGKAILNKGLATVHGAERRIVFDFPVYDPLAMLAAHTTT